VEVVSSGFVRPFLLLGRLPHRKGPVVTRPVAQVADVVEVGVDEVAGSDRSIGRVGLVFRPGVRSRSGVAAADEGAVAPEFLYGFAPDLVFALTGLRGVFDPLEAGLADRRDLSQTLDLVLG